MARGLEPIYFDQKRESLDPERTLWGSLVPDGGDSLLVQGKQRHVVSYLRDYLFSEDQARQPVSSLSGGERARLLLARLFARPSRLIVMDEPTNDLDMETLDLLEEVLDGYEGTLLLVSHDRDFLDRLASGIIAFEAPGKVGDYAGGYSDYRRQREARGDAQGAHRDRAKTPAKSGIKPKQQSAAQQREAQLQGSAGAGPSAGRNGKPDGRDRRPGRKAGGTRLLSARPRRASRRRPTGLPPAGPLSSKPRSAGWSSRT